MRASLLVTLIALMGISAFAADPKPIGDAHVDALQDEDADFESAMMVLRRQIVDGGWSIASVQGTANRMADAFDHMCVHLCQFYMWEKYWLSKSAPEAEFSLEARQKLAHFAPLMKTGMMNGIKELTDAIAKNPQYGNDPQISAALRRVAESGSNLARFRAKLDGK